MFTEDSKCWGDGEKSRDWEERERERESGQRLEEEVNVCKGQ